VYNALPYLREMLDSLAAQDLDASTWDVIAVDDGSTDGSGEVLDQYGREHDNAMVIHQENSGWPGEPRNVGLRASEARWVFFADADDILAPGALRRLVDFAEQHDSDIVIPRLTPLGGRAFPTAVYEKTVVNADLLSVFETFFSQKLYRRELLLANNIWFPEGKVRLEDGIFNAHAYMHADRISILADGTFYFLRARDDGQQLSRDELQPAGYTASISTICSTVRNHMGSSDAAEQIILDVYRRKCLHIYQPGRFAKYDEATQEAWVEMHRSFTWQFISDAMEQWLDSPWRERAYFVRRGDREGLLALAKVEGSPVITAVVRGTRWTTDGIELLIDASIAGRLGLPRQVICEVLRRDGEGASAFPIVRRSEEIPGYGETSQYLGILPDRSISALLPGTYDVNVASIRPAERLSARLRWDERLQPPSTKTGFRIYPTKGGQVSIQKSELSLRQALGRVVDTFRSRR
jgi:poly(ribitol-phosphate) beta-N-acetylglucosaminyltransferase